MRPTNKLTELTIKQAKPAEKQYKLTDGGGMHLLVHPNGSKYWRMKYSFDDKEKTLALGVWPEVSLTEARNRRKDARKMLRDEIDPLEARWERKRQRQEQKRQQEKAEQTQATTFMKVALEWMQKQGPRWTDEHCKRVRRSLEMHVFPEIGHRPITEIDAQEMLAALRGLEMQEKHEAAHRARQRCEGVFRYGIVTGQCQHNPAVDLRGALTAKTVKHLAALRPDELPEFLRRLDEYDGHPVTKLAMRFMIYTFVRTGELRHAEWREFDTRSDEPTWTIPPARMKMRREHQVPLSFQAIEILEQMEQFSGPEGLVFPQQDNPHRPMSENTLLYALYRMGYHSRATTHGFRATASTILNESGKWHPDAIERQLAHAEGNKVRAAYDRSLHMGPRREMMQWWADQVDSLMIPADVIELAERRRTA